MVPEHMAHSDPSSSSPSTGVQPVRRPPPPPPPPVEVPQLPNNHLLPVQIRLDRTNYSVWRVIVLAAVRAYDLEGYLLGTIPSPPLMLPRTVLDPGDLPNPAFIQWQRLDQFLYQFLKSLIAA